MADADKDSGPDLTQGISIRDLGDRGMLAGHVGDDSVLVARVGDDVFAVGAHCTHYHGPLAKGLIVGETVRCPWHHACFSLRTGEPLRAPALDNIECWRVERQGDRIVVREKAAPQGSPALTSKSVPESIVILGGGAAGLAAADMARRRGYDGAITIISSDSSAPVDRPNLSKDYLAGHAQEDWIPLRSADWYAEQRIDLLLDTPVTAIDPLGRRVVLKGGATRSFGALLIATGADPVRLPIPGSDGPRVYYLRSFADSRRLVATTTSAKRAVVVGASFIGLEVAASLRARNVEVDVVAPGSAPLERVMGTEVGGSLRKLYESHGVRFHLGETVSRVDDRKVTLSGGSTLDADVVVMGVGVQPVVALAEQAGLAIDRGIVVNEYLETSAAGVFAAGDIARWPDPHTGESIRVEHWVVAERQGQVAARNMLGARERFDAVPFFWSQHFDVTINYVGHAEKWDAVAIDGSLDGHDCTITYTKSGKRLAVATMSRDRASLEAEAAMERE